MKTLEFGPESVLQKGFPQSTLEFSYSSKFHTADFETLELRPTHCMPCAELTLDLIPLDLALKNQHFWE